MFAHPQVVVTTPHRDVPTFLKLHIWAGEMLGRGKVVSCSSQHSEVPIGVVLLFGLYLAVEEGIVVEFTISWGGEHVYTISAEIQL